MAISNVCFCNAKVHTDPGWTAWDSTFGAWVGVERSYVPQVLQVRARSPCVSLAVLEGMRGSPMSLCGPYSCMPGWVFNGPTEG